MSPGIRDQLLLLVDEVEQITVEVFEAVQQGNQAENLLEMLIKKDRELAELLLVAKSQKQLHQSICKYKEEVAKYNARIERFQAKLLEAENELLPALYQAKERLGAIRDAESNQIAAEDIVKYSHKISACHATSAPTGWLPGDPRRPYPTDVDMRAGILPQITTNGFVQPVNAHDIPRPPAQLGTDGLATLMKDNTMPTQIGTTWRSSKSSDDTSSMRPGTSPALHPPTCSSPTGSSSSSSDSSIGD